jgi:hypothetical protein
MFVLIREKKVLTAPQKKWLENLQFLEYINNQKNSMSYFWLCNTGLHHHHDIIQLRNKKSGPKDG